MRQTQWFESPQLFNSSRAQNNGPLTNLLSPFPFIIPTSSQNALQPRLFFTIETPKQNIYRRIIFEEALERIISSESDYSVSRGNDSEPSVISESIEFSDSELSMLSIQESLVFAVNINATKDMGVVGKIMPIHQQKRKSQQKSRNRLRGMKIISQRIWIMLDELKAVRQDQIATRLLLYLNSQEFKGQDREEQNIKKRVVDALSILMASGEIIKKGSKLVIKQDKKDRKVSECQLAEINALRKELAKKQEILASKRQKMREVKAKRKVLKTLLERNQNRKNGNKAKIQFPFIGIMNGNSQARIKQPSKDKALISSSQVINMFGDIDSLRWLKNATISELVNKKSHKK